MILNSKYNINIFLGDVDLFGSGSASSVQCKIIESIEFGIPTCMIAFSSSKDFFKQYPIVDGTKIIINIQSNFYSINEQYVFRITEIKSTPVGTSDMAILINGIYDCYEMFRSAYKYGLYGNSSDVFKNFMQKNKLSGTIHTTKDMQLWCPSEINLGQWLSYVANHAWASQQSGMFWAMDRTGYMYYLDIDRLIYQENKPFIFYYGNPAEDDEKNKIYRYKSYALHIDSGNENLYNCGYNGNNFHFDLSSYSIKKENANKVRAASEIVNINKELSRGLVDDILQFDVGNHHEHFFMASSQNKRVLSTYSTYTELMCDNFYPIYVGNVCKLQTINAGSSGGKVEPFDIKYVINKIILTIVKSSINMNITLCSQGYNAESVETY